MPSLARRPLLAALALVLLLPLLPSVARAAPGDLTDEERQRIEDAQELTAEERRRIENADEMTAEERQRIDRARAAVARVEERIADVTDRIAATEDELDRLQADLNEASQELSRAEAVATAAEEAARDAQEKVDRIQGELTDARDERRRNTADVQSLARDTFMYGPGSSDPMMMIVNGLSNVEGASDLAQSSHSLDIALRDRTAILEDAERLVAETELLEDEARMLEQARKERFAEADEARAEAAELHARVLDLVEETDTALRRQQDLKTELANEREQAEDRAADVVDAVEAAAQARQEEARAAAEAAAEQRAEEARSEAEAAAAERAEQARREAEAARQAAAEAARKAEEAAEAEARAEAEAEEEEEEEESDEDSGSESSSSSSSGGSVSVSRSGGLATVGGITVDDSIADELAALLEAARADGITLGGSGYRSPETTERLRIANGCPDVYESPASSCRVPTAIPGSSMHEQGLAIDFSYNGATLCYPYSASSCHGNPAFDWLWDNAGDYGFQNLPSEAWHWSTNGH